MQWELARTTAPVRKGGATEGNCAGKRSEQGSIVEWRGGGRRQARQVPSERPEEDCRGPLVLLSAGEGGPEIGEGQLYAHTDEPACFPGPGSFLSEERWPRLWGLA